MISKEKIQLVIDLLYFDSQKSQQDQRPLTKLAEESKVSSSTVVKVRNILKDMVLQDLLQSIKFSGILNIQNPMINLQNQFIKNMQI